MEYDSRMCNACGDTGIVYFNACVYACNCEKGAPNREPKYFASDRKKERPFFMPVFGKPNPNPIEHNVKPFEPDERKNYGRPYKDD